MLSKVSNLISVWPGSYQELCMVIAGEKPSLFDGLSKRDNKDLVEKTLKGFGLETEIWASTEDPADLSIAVGKSKNVCLEVKKAREVGDFYTLGTLLGYPQCCIKSHLSTQGDGFLSREEADIFKEGDNMRLDYRVNTLLNTQSIGSEGLRNLGPNLEKYFGHEYYYLSHIPCSAECEKSFEIAKKTKDVIEKYLPEENKKIEQKLKRGFIIFGFLDYIIFNYKKDGGCLKINNVIKTPIADNDKLEKIKRAEWLTLGENTVVTSNNETLKCRRTVIFY